MDRKNIRRKEMQASSSRKKKSRKQASNVDITRNLEKKLESELTYLLTIFPKEVWLLIFEKADTDTLENACNSSSFFRQVLLPFRVNFLLKNVLKILEKQNNSEGLRKCDRIFNRAANDPGYNSPGISCCDMLKLRLVSRSWCSSVDNFFQNHAAHYELNKGSNLLSRAKCFYLPLIRGKCKYIRFLFDTMDTTYQTTGRNPIFGKGVQIVIDVFGFQNGIENIFRKYGSQISYLYIHLMDSSCAILNQDMRTVLELVPNLKVLHILSHTAYLQEAEIWSKPLPTLESLQVLSTFGVDPLVFEKLISANGHVSTINVRRRKTETPFKLNKVPLPNLSALSCEIFSREEFLELFNGLSANWSLSLLHLNLTLLKDANWTMIFQGLSDCFKYTLTHLRIMFPDTLYEMKFTPENYKVVFPRLTNLELSFKRTLINLDFVLALRNTLTDLRVKVEQQNRKINTYRTDVNSSKGLVVDLLRFEGAELQSNILRNFPMLEAFDFDFRGGRAGYGSNTFRKYWASYKKKP